MFMWRVNKEENSGVVTIKSLANFVIMLKKNSFQKIRHFCLSFPFNWDFPPIDIFVYAIFVIFDYFLCA